MITNNFKAALGMMLASFSFTSTSDITNAIPVTDVENNTRYMSNFFNGNCYPSLVTATPTLSATSRGISVGSDDTPAAATDYNLGSTITSGISLALSNIMSGSDGADDPYCEYTITVTNTGASAVTINEIGYKQFLFAANTQGHGSSSTRVFLIDRTVLDSPLVIPAGGSGVITYRLKTVTSA